MRRPVLLAATGSFAALLPGAARTKRGETDVRNAQETRDKRK